MTGWDAVAVRAPTYRRHAPEQVLLYQILCEHLETFLQECRTEAHGLPAYVERDLPSPSSMLDALPIIPLNPHSP